MTPCPPIATYHLSRGPGSAPAWLARYIVATRDKRGTVTNEFLPMVFAASYEAGAIDAAEAFWRSEQAKIEARADRLAAARDTRKRRRKEGAG
jgi:hypothetical protein